MRKEYEKKVTKCLSLTTADHSDINVAEIIPHIQPCLGQFINFPSLHASPALNEPFLNHLTIVERESSQVSRDDREL